MVKRFQIRIYESITLDQGLKERTMMVFLALQCSVDVRGDIMGNNTDTKNLTYGQSPSRDFKRKYSYSRGCFCNLPLERKKLLLSSYSGPFLIHPSL